jgi:hypothetical protein
MAREPADSADLISVQLSRWLAFTMRVPTLGDHVGHIVAMRSKEEVSWIHASWIVAAVQDMKAERDRTERKLVGDTMRVQFAAARHVPLWVCADLSVTVALAFSLPRPACVWSTLLHLCPKASRQALLATADRGLHGC